MQSNNQTIFKELESLGITGVKDMEGDLYQGIFQYTGKPDNNYVRLLMAHILAAVKFKILVNSEYDALRTIKLKSMELSTTTATMTATVTLKPNTTDTNPIYSVEYTPAGTSSTVSLLESTDGEALSSTIAKELTCYIAPSVNDALTLTSIYDVYDKNGNLIRENCPATNKLPELEVGIGQYLTLNLTINPTYLFIMSEPDLETTIEIEH